MDSTRYRYVRRLGRGGMAEVFEAVAVGDSGFERRVALKRILPELTQGAHGAAFLDEARLASRLHHPNVVAVLDFGLLDGVPFQILEFVDGLDVGRLKLQATAEGRALPLPVALALCLQVAHALGAAHEASDDSGRPLGIVHRDVSPGNVLVGWSGVVKLADFGIAFARDRVARTIDGAVKGTPMFMAPEQLVGGEVDARTDLFALGCLLSELCGAGSPLAREGAMADLLAGRTLPVPVGLPADVTAIVVRATAPRRGDRFARAAELAGALGTALHARSSADPVAVVREWVAGLRPGAPAAAPVPVRGLLDGVLGLALVGVQGDGARKFSSQLAAVEAPAEVAADGGGAGAGPGAEESVARPRRSRAAVVVVVLALASVGGVVAWLATRGTGKGSGAAVVEVDAGPSVAIVEADAAPIVVALSVDAALVVELPPTPKPSPSRSPSTRPSPSPSPSTSTPPTPSPTPIPTSAGEGYIAIGGERVTRAEILLDGRSFGFAPKRISTSTGSHRLELILPDGTHLGPVELQVSALHTPRSPLRPTF